MAPVGVVSGTPASVQKKLSNTPKYNKGFRGCGGGTLLKKGPSPTKHLRRRRFDIMLKESPPLAGAV